MSEVNPPSVFDLSPAELERREREAERFIRQRAVEMSIDFYRDSSVSSVKGLMDTSALIAQFILGKDAGTA